MFTDNNPLLYILQPTKLNCCGQRWVSELSEFNFSIKYRPGVVNKDADCLSRLPLDMEKYISHCTEEVGVDAFKAIVAEIQVQIQDNESWKAVINSLHVGDVLLKIDEKIYDAESVKNEQINDVSITEIIKILKGNTPTVVDKTPKHEIFVYIVFKFSV